MQSPPKQLPNHIPPTPQPTFHFPPSLSDPLPPTNQQFSLSNKLSSEINAQKTSSTQINASKASNPLDFPPHPLPKQEPNTKPTNDRQEGNLPVHNVPTLTHPSKKPLQVIEILDDDDDQDHIPSGPNNNPPTDNKFGLENKQKFKNKQISNPFKTSTNPKLDNHLLKNHDLPKNDPFFQKTPSFSQKPQLWQQKYSQPPSKPNSDKKNQFQLPKHLQHPNKLPFSDQFTNTQLLHQSLFNRQFYDRFYYPGSGINFPHSLVNFPIGTQNPFQWNTNPNALERFGQFQQNPSSLYSSMFGPPDANLLGKNMTSMPFMNNTISAIKNFSQINPVNQSKLLGPSSSLFKDTKIPPSNFQKPFSTLNNSIQKSQEDKRKQTIPNVPLQPKQQIVKTVSSQSNPIGVQQNNGKDLQKKDSVVSMGEKKKQPQVIDLLNSDDEEVPVANKNSYKNPFDNRTNPFIFQQRSPWGQNINSQQIKSQNSTQNQKQQQSGKVFKEGANQPSYLQKTKQIHKQQKAQTNVTKSIQQKLDFNPESMLRFTKYLQEVKNNASSKIPIQFENTAKAIKPVYPNYSFPLAQDHQHQLINFKSAGRPQNLEQTMNNENYALQKLFNLQNFAINRRKDASITQTLIEQNKRLFDSFTQKTENDIKNLRENPPLTQHKKIIREIIPENKSQKPKISNPTSSNPFGLSGRQIPGNQLVKRDAQKAYQKTRSRWNQQSKQSSAQKYNDQGKPLLTYERMQELRQNGKKQMTAENLQKRARVPTIMKRETSEKEVKGREKMDLENEEKDGGWVFEWTPKLKRLRDLAKKREYDSVILTGPQFQAELPRFITDESELRSLKAIKRANLLKRMYKYCAQI